MHIICIVLYFRVSLTCYSTMPDLHKLTPADVLLRTDFECKPWMLDHSAPPIDGQKEVRPLYGRLSKLRDDVLSTGIYTNPVSVSSMLSQGTTPTVRAYRPLPSKLKEAVVRVATSQLASEVECKRFTITFDQALVNLAEMRSNRTEELDAPVVAFNPLKTSWYEVEVLVLEDFFDVLKNGLLERVRLNIFDALLNREHARMFLFFRDEQDKRTFQDVITNFVGMSLRKNLGCTWTDDELHTQLAKLKSASVFHTDVLTSEPTATKGSYGLLLSQGAVEAVSIGAASLILGQATEEQLKVLDRLKNTLSALGELAVRRQTVLKNFRRVRV